MAFIHPILKNQINSQQILPVIAQLSPSRIETLLTTLPNAQVMSGGVIPRFGMIALLATKKDIKALNQLPYVNSIGFNDVVQSFNDYNAYGPYKDIWIGTEESRKYIGADRAEEQGITGKGIKVAVLDTGSFPSHPQLNFKVDDVNAIVPSLPGANPLEEIFKSSTFKGLPVGYDDNGHGTHCLTTIGGSSLISKPYKIGVKGVAPGCDLTSIKVLATPMGIGMNSDIIRGIDIAINRGVDVISMSLGSKEGDNNTPVCQAIKMALKENPGLTFVVAAGNFGPGKATMGSPACCEEALTVGSISIVDGNVSYFSSRGPTEDNLIKPDVLGPGGGRYIDPEGEYDEYIYSGTSPGTVLDVSGDGMSDGYAGLHGTSMATPHVAGLVALLKQINRDVDAKYIKDVMKAKVTNKSYETGWGLIKYQDFIKE